MSTLARTAFRSALLVPKTRLVRPKNSPPSYRSMASLFGSNTFDPDKDIPDLTGKAYIVTGGSAGIGFGIAAHLIQHNAKVIILSNKEDHAKSAIDELKEYGDASKANWVQCDLEDLRQTDRVAKELGKSHKKIDALVLNAGLGVGVYNETKDRLDSHFQVNHLSQLHLALTLLPILRATPESRIVMESSDLHRMAASDVRFADEAEINQDVGPSRLYNRSKLAQILTVRALQRRIDAGHLGCDGARRQIHVNAVHPGAVATDQQAQAEEAYGALGVIGSKLVRPFMKDPVKSGCRPALYATTSPEIIDKDIGGQYIVPDNKVTDPSRQAQDDDMGERLWRLSEGILRDRLS